LDKRIRFLELVDKRDRKEEIRKIRDSEKREKRKRRICLTFIQKLLISLSKHI